jgi:hypothetical protein
MNTRELEVVTPDVPREEARVETRGWQFSLLEAFWFLTAAGGAAALVRGKGWGAVVVVVGLFVAWLNVRGRFAEVQAGKRRAKLFWGAWGLLGASLFLPAMRGCNNSTLKGWETAHLCAAAEVGAVEKFVVQGERPPREELGRAVGELSWITLLNLANLLAVLSPVWLWRLRREKGQWLGAALAVAAVAVWIVPLKDPHVLVGCYVWCAGFLALTLPYRIGWKTFVAMLLLAMVLVVI